jgi:hypothetical protein
MFEKTPSLKLLLQHRVSFNFELLGKFEIKSGNILRYRPRPRQCGWMKNRVKNLLALSL